MAVNLSPVGGVAAQFFDNSGNVLTGGLLYTYLAGTTTPAVTYTTNSGITSNSNPVVLDAAGRVPNSGEIWLTDGISYKFVLQDQNAVQIATWDNIVGINSNFVAYTGQTETQSATQGQTIFTFATIQYLPGTNNLAVFVNGSKQIASVNYQETSTTVVTFVDGLNVGDVVQFNTAESISTNSTSASNVSFTGFKGQIGNVQNLADDDGSDWIGFIQDGTGAVAVSAQDKMRQIVSIKDFGAVGDGVTDDTAAIQAALDLNLPVYIPYTADGYLVSDTLVASNNVTCDGFLLADTSFASIVFDVQGGIYDAKKLVIQGLSVQPTSSLVAGSIGIRVFSPNVELRNCFATQFDYGIQVASYLVTLNNCWSRQNNTNLSAYAPSSSSEINDLTVNGGSYDSAILYSCYIGDDRFTTTVLSTDQMGVNILFTGANFDGAPSLFNRVFNLTLQSCYWETTTVASKKGIVLGNSSYASLMRNVVISNCYFSTINYPIYCNTSIRNLVVQNNYFVGSVYCGLYYVGLGGSGSFQYLRNESTSGFTGPAVHTGFLAVSTPAVTFQGVTIADDWLTNGVQSAPKQNSTTNWYPYGITSDGYQNTSSVAQRFKSSPSTSKAGTLSGTTFTFTTLSDCYAFNGGDALTVTGAGAGAGYVGYVDYVAGTMNVQLAAGPALGASTVSQIIVTFT